MMLMLQHLLLLQSDKFVSLQHLNNSLFLVWSIHLLLN